MYRLLRISQPPVAYAEDPPPLLKPTLFCNIPRSLFLVVQPGLRLRQDTLPRRRRSPYSEAPRYCIDIHPSTQRVWCVSYLRSRKQSQAISTDAKINPPSTPPITSLVASGQSCTSMLLEAIIIIAGMDHDDAVSRSLSFKPRPESYLPGDLPGPRWLAAQQPYSTFLDQDSFMYAYLCDHGGWP